MGIQMIKEDKEGNKYVEINGEKFYITNVDETIDDILTWINFLRQTEKTARKYEEDDDELFEVIRKKIAFYSAVLKEIYSD
jgi:hypothetical protein